MCDEYPILVLDWTVADRYLADFYEDKKEEDYLGWMIVYSGMIAVKNKISVLFTTEPVAKNLITSYGSSNPLGLGSLFEATQVEGGVLDSQPPEESCVRLCLLQAMGKRPVYLVTISSKLKEKADKSKINVKTPKEAFDILKKLAEP
jgi:hypothetical protein